MSSRSTGSFKAFCFLGTCLLAAILVGLGCSASNPMAIAPTRAGVSFEGKTISLVIPSGPGGGTDILTRALYAPSLSKFLPGKPTVIVRNMPGGELIVGTNYVHGAKADGLTLVVASVSVHFAQLLGKSAVRYDLTKMPQIVGAGAASIYFTRPEVAKKPEDSVKAQGMIVGLSPAPAALFIAIKEMLDIPTNKVVSAYVGSGDSVRAFLSGETNTCAGSTTEYMASIAQLAGKGEVVPLFQSGLLNEKGELARAPGFAPDIPTVKEVYEKLYNKPPSGIAWEAVKAFIGACRNYDKLLALPPGTPDNITRIYRDAAEKMLKDPEFLKSADRLGEASSRWVAGEGLAKEFNLNFAIKPEVRDWYRNTLPKYGIAVE